MKKQASIFIYILIGGLFGLITGVLGNILADWLINDVLEGNYSIPTILVVVLLCLLGLGAGAWIGMKSQLAEEEVGERVATPGETLIEEPAIPLDQLPRARKFVGRNRELVRLLAELRPGAVVEICGPGGMGKTALAAEAVWTLTNQGKEVPQDFPDGVFVHSFYQNPDAYIVIERLSWRLGRGSATDWIETTPTPVEFVRDLLAGRRMLLVLDGAEQAQNLQMLLNIKGQCGVLITSRKRGTANPEWQDLSPLALPEALELLNAWSRERATGDKAGEQICELTGFLPMAIVLAGSYLNASETRAEEYVTWLQESPLQALDHGERRMQSVPRLIERCLEDVGANSRQVFGLAGMLALAPFQRFWVKACLPLREDEVLAGFGELVRYGLFRREGNLYRPNHKLVHDYAREKINPPENALEKISTFCFELVQRMRMGETDGIEETPYLCEHSLAILDLLAVKGKWQEWESLAQTLVGELERHGHISDRIRLAEMGIEAASQQGDQKNEAFWLQALGRCNTDRGSMKAAIECYERALVIYRETNDRHGEGKVLSMMGVAYRYLGDATQAISLHEQALDIFRQEKDRGAIGKELGNLGIAHRHQGETRLAIACHQEALEIAREMDDRRREGVELGCLGIAHSRLGKLREAIEYHEQALAIARETGDSLFEGAWLENLGADYFTFGQMDKAREYYLIAQEFARRSGNRREEGHIIGNQGLVFSALGEPRNALHHHQQALTIAREINDRRGEGDQLLFIATAYFVLGEAGRALEHLEPALEIARQTGDRYKEAEILGSMGYGFGLLSQSQNAIGFYEKALGIVREIEDRLGECKTLSQLGYAWYTREDYEKTIQYCQEALEIARQVGSRKTEGNSLSTLGLAYLELGDVDQAIECHKQALEIADETGDILVKGIQFGNLGRAHKRLGDTNKAIDFFHTALEIQKEVGNRYGQGIWLVNLGQAHATLGEYGEAVYYYEDALEIDIEIGNRQGEANNLYNLAIAYSNLGKSDLAQEMMVKAFEVYTDIGSPMAESARVWLEQARNQ